jgi:hypothetical protein
MSMRQSLARNGAYRFGNLRIALGEMTEFALIEL